MCGCSDYWGRHAMKITLREVNRKLLPNKVMMINKRQRTTATFTVSTYARIQNLNHMASELHNKRIRESQTREMVAINMNDGDDEALLDNTTGDFVTCDEQEMATFKLLDLSSAYLMDYMNEKLDNVVDNTRHATKAKYGHNDHMWVKYQNKDFMLFNQQMTWMEAQSVCYSLGGFLATVSNSDDVKFIKSMTSVYPNTVGLGGTDMFAEGRWLWIENEFRANIIKTLVYG
ncbi:unnamed protein product [Mytilus coruscus]|uniref:C-type lectin domain-containing protein n=1 Tax=Mytilus coruscus TaxID=42192 RepID=A0A6J8A983_MYTCO|nr:unnamed protein product [Mytilus coruscus]